MTADVLVAYATRHESTAEVAGTIAGCIEAAGYEVDLAPAHGVLDPAHGYSLVVLGGPLCRTRWHPDAHWFLRHHRTALAHVPVAVFAMGPRTDKPKAWLRSRAQLDRALAGHRWLTPVSIAVFGGVDPPDRRSPRDLRDWDAIASWALTLPAPRPTATGRPHSPGGRRGAGP
jgi:menaquinone-dependent protoporphyrinogen oxidase